jgi:hypothetical protein
MVPWVGYGEILQKQISYDPAKFRNECLGLPTMLGDHIVTRAEVEACCSQRPMAHSVRDVPPHAVPWLVVGIDWGGGVAARTVLTIGYMRRNNVFEVCHLSSFAANEDPNYLLQQVAQRCRQFGVRFIGADGGGSGFHLNRLLVGAVGLPMYSIFYTQSDHAPRQNGVLWDWSVHRSATIGTLFQRIKARLISFPRIEDCSSFLDEFSCEVAEYNEHMRTLKYTHPETQPDDAMHATNYALLMATRMQAGSDDFAADEASRASGTWEGFYR